MERTKGVHDTLASHIHSLEARVAALESDLARAKSAATQHDSPPKPGEEAMPVLSAEEIRRYSRQMIVPGFGAWTQQVLSALRVLIVGAGGLGCPSALYLASAGVGFIGVVDDDVVEPENLHRQIGHADRRTGWSKAESLVTAMQALNPHTAFLAISGTRFGPGNAEDLVKGYHIVVDCSDNPATRYVCNDACVLGNKILVSGAAVGTDGQISTYNYRIRSDRDAPGSRSILFGDSDAPCYRCLHPVPPPTGAVVSCSDAGVLGPVTGVIGSMQAMEVLKIASSIGAHGGVVPAWDAGRKLAVWRTIKLEPTASASDAPASLSGFGQVLSGRLFAFDGADSKARVVKLRSRRSDCLVCGEGATPAEGDHAIKCLEDTAAWLALHGLIPREGSGSTTTAKAAAPCECGPAAPTLGDDAADGNADLEMTVDALASALSSSSSSPSSSSPAARPPLVIDVRSREQFSMCSLPGSVHIPLGDLEKGDLPATLAKAGLSLETDLLSRSAANEPVFVICRRGIFSLDAARILRSHGVSTAASVTGGLTEWAARVDTAFPRY